MTYKRFLSAAAVASLALSGFMMAGASAASAAENESKPDAGRVIHFPSKFGNKGDGLLIIKPSPGAKPEAPKPPLTQNEINKKIIGS
ncbi:hypothetical protein [Dermatophilus congolensis]|uniref:Uncharacterized protein n=1 Tax=Dermatophilus congolensis TaxID=1863 RepID=A0A239V6K0_9MICO|nr:hypothetical protein [Dermatophilus congolensis]MBO3130323.1 hypothetical protein [Dermatophilus congolensis]MBO3131046.1 hypothetical protein [Dermatophilus congolensis]MBO3134794.1 hypothetical protein [Dermatophilus congolensis]MBO3137030.1 hypothetical protein [Dermatophilus congolensis]MBO3139275.1 hypothetical protein [Dermatophilus congolensis]